jgi:hypothetical protein
MSQSPSIVPEDADRDVYLVLDDFGGRLGRAWRETDEADTDRSTLIRDMLDGQYNPCGWSPSIRPSAGRVTSAKRLRTRCLAIHLREGRCDDGTMRHHHGQPHAIRRRIR